MEQIIEKIANRIKETNPYKIILFGSAAYGSASENNDIDIIVVTKDETMPMSYRENFQVYLKISTHLKDIRKEVPIDLIVYTKPMFKKFVNQGSLFSKEILEKGRVLYEENHKRMAESGTG